MRGGQTPIHIQRFAPADLHNDEHVKLLEARRDYATLTFYRNFIDYSFTGGGDLPADPEALAAVVKMPQRDVERALLFCLDRLVFRDGDRLYQRRVRREVAKELEFRESQSRVGRLGGRPASKGKPKATVSDSRKGTESPPYAVRRTPSPAPSNGERTTDSGAVAPATAEPPERSWSNEAAEDFRAAYHGSPPAQFFAQLKPVAKRFRWDVVRPVLVAVMAETPLEYLNLAKVLAVRVEQTLNGYHPPARGPTKPTVNQRSLQALANFKARRSVDAEGSGEGGPIRDVADEARRLPPPGGGRGDP